MEGDNGRTTFGTPAPINLGDPKNVQISATFLATFDFDREYLRNGKHIEHLKKNLINRNPLHVGRKNGELWSTNKSSRGAY